MDRAGVGVGNDILIDSSTSTITSSVLTGGRGGMGGRVNAADAVEATTRTLTDLAKAKFALEDQYKKATEAAREFEIELEVERKYNNQMKGELNALRDADNNRASADARQARKDAMAKDGGKGNKPKRLARQDTNNPARLLEALTEAEGDLEAEQARSEDWKKRCETQETQLEELWKMLER
jgi:hypothetical protein